MKAGALSMFRVSVVFFLTSMISGVANAAVVHDDRFEDYLGEPGGVYEICIGFVPPPPGLTQEFGSLCLELFGASYAGSSAGFTSVNNIGTTGAVTRSSTGAASSVRSNVKDRLEELEEQKNSGGAGADGSSGWGLLIAAQSGEAEREETINENGYESDLKGLALGADYRFSNEFVLGIAFGTTEDDADFDNSNGSLLTESDSFTVYGTWAPSDVMYLDGYIGITKMDFESVRFTTFGTNPTETVFGEMEGDQLLAGISGGYDWYVSSLSIGVFANIDYIETTIDEYDETGTTTLRLRYFEQETESLTSSLGLRLSQYSSLSWATLVPNARVMFVHEYQDDARMVASTLVVAPISPFIVETDAPDRNYILLGLGITAALQGSTQIYLDYEQQTNHDFLDTWTVSAGLLTEF